MKNRRTPLLAEYLESVNRGVRQVRARRLAWELIIPILVCLGLAALVWYLKVP